MLALLLEMIVKEEANMKYINANMILPDELVAELQNYVQAGYLYIPAKDGARRSWGELSGYRKELDRRNAAIITAYHDGTPMEALADRYHLSTHTIKKIIYQK